MKFLWLITNVYLAYVTAQNYTNHSSKSLTDKERDGEIHVAVKSLMAAIETHLNQDGTLSKRNYYGSYPSFMNNYYHRAYGIVRAGCYSHRRFYKRSTNSKEVQEVKVIQKQLAVAWNDVINQRNSVFRRGLINPNALNDGFQAAAGQFNKAADTLGQSFKQKAGKPLNEPEIELSGGSNQPKVDQQNVETVDTDRVTDDFLKKDADSDLEDLSTGTTKSQKDSEKETVKPAELTKMEKFRKTGFWIVGSATVFLILFKLIFGQSHPTPSQFTGMDDIPYDYLDADVTYG